MLRISLASVLVVLTAAGVYINSSSAPLSNASYRTLPSGIEGTWVVDKDKMTELLDKRGQLEAGLRYSALLAERNQIKLNITKAAVESESTGRTERITYNVSLAVGRCANLEARTSTATAGHNPLSNARHSATFCLDGKNLALIDPNHFSAPIEYYRRR